MTGRPSTSGCRPDKSVWANELSEVAAEMLPRLTMSPYLRRCSAMTIKDVTTEQSEIVPCEIAASTSWLYSGCSLLRHPANVAACTSLSGISLNRAAGQHYEEQAHGADSPDKGQVCSACGCGANGQPPAGDGRGAVQDGVLLVCHHRRVLAQLYQPASALSRTSPSAIDLRGRLELLALGGLDAFSSLQELARDILELDTRRIVAAMPYEIQVLLRRVYVRRERVVVAARQFELGRLVASILPPR